MKYRFVVSKFETVDRTTKADRLKLKYAQARRRASPVKASLPAVGLCASVLVGGWWTGAAVVDGDPNAVSLRFSLSVLAGLYYLVLNNVARTGRLRQAPAWPSDPTASRRYKEHHSTTRTTNPVTDRRRTGDSTTNTATHSGADR